MSGQHCIQRARFFQDLSVKAVEIGEMLLKRHPGQYQREALVIRRLDGDGPRQVEKTNISDVNLSGPPFDIERASPLGVNNQADIIDSAARDVLRRPLKRGGRGAAGNDSDICELIAGQLRAE